MIDDAGIDVGRCGHDVSPLGPALVVDA
jgi:hypothetical protein